MQLFSSNSTSQRAWKLVCIPRERDTLRWTVNPGAHGQLELMKKRLVGPALGWPCPGFLCPPAFPRLDTAQPDQQTQPSCTIIMYRTGFAKQTLPLWKTEFSNKAAEQNIRIQPHPLWSQGNRRCFLADKIQLTLPVWVIQTAQKLEWQLHIVQI